MPGRDLLLGIMFMLNANAIASEPTARELPSVELLEFLGDWETADGEWIDPTELEQMGLPEQAPAEGERDES